MKKPHNIKQASEALSNAVGKLYLQDSFTNAMARMGTFQPNVTEGAQYPITRLSRNYNLLNSLYRNHWIVRRIIDVVAQDMIREWVEFTSDMSPEETNKINQVIRHTRIKQKLIEGIKWGDLYGGAAGLMVIEGQEDLSQPLDIDSVLPGDFKGLIILDRWSGIYPLLETVDDIDSTDYGLPKYYMIQDPANASPGYENQADKPIEGTYKVHHSRIIRFIGDDLPLWEKLAESYWGASVIERMFDELKKRDNTSWNIASLVFLANLKVLKMQDYGQLLSLTNSKAKKNLYNALESQNMLLNNMGIYVLDKDDDFQTFQYSFSGLPEIYEKQMLDISGAANIPATKLYGRSPEGMNATGESDEANYNGDIEQKQEAKLRGEFDSKLFPVIAKSALGYVPDDLDFNFKSIETISQKEIAERIWRSTEAIRGAYTDGLISQKIGLMELKHLGKDIGIFTNITDEDIAKASDDLENPNDLMNNPFEQPQDEVNGTDGLEVQEEEQE